MFEDGELRRKARGKRIVEEGGWERKYIGGMKGLPALPA